MRRGAPLHHAHSALFSRPCASSASSKRRSRSARRKRQTERASATHRCACDRARDAARALQFVGGSRVAAARAARARFGRIRRRTLVSESPVSIGRKSELSDGFLHKYFLNNAHKRLHKWVHYFDIYERHFERFRGKSPTMIEIGVQGGGSLAMWKEYFGPGSRTRIAAISIVTMAV